MIFSNSRKSMISSSDNSSSARKAFLKRLDSKLTEKGIESSQIIAYYDELIQDAIDSGVSIPDFMAKLGSVDAIAGQIDSLKINSDSGWTNANTRSKVSNSFSKVFVSLFNKGIGLLIVGISFGLLIFGVSIAVSGLSEVIRSEQAFGLQLQHYGLLALGLGLALVGIGYLADWRRHNGKHISQSKVTVQKALYGGRK